MSRWVWSDFQESFVNLDNFSSLYAFEDKDDWKIMGIDIPGEDWTLWDGCDEDDCYEIIDNWLSSKP